MKTIIEDPLNYLPEITEVYCFVSVDEGGEGIIAESFLVHGHMMMMPLVCADKAHVEGMKLMARGIAKKTGKKIRLIKLTKREFIEEIK